MLRVLTLGGLSVESSGKPLATAQVRPQGLGLLARLAVAGERGLSREKLVGYFWPEKDERSALHSLSQALHRLRHDVGFDEIVLGTRILRLDTTHVSSDVGDLEAAHRAGDAQRVTELYAGPFLDGIFFSGAPDLERWIEGERKRLSDIHRAALWKLALAAGAAGQHGESARWWQSLVDADPLDSRVALELVKALAAAGDDAGAMREARRHQALVRTELQMEPDPRIEAAIARFNARELPSKPKSAFDAGAREVDRASRNALTADELCARGRQCFFTFTPKGFAEGIRYVERAIAIDPKHAQAHVTLGWLCILLSQGVDPDAPRRRGIAACRRAETLDPTLADVQLALSWAAQLDERFDEAEMLARRGVALDPAYPFAHFVLAWACMNHGVHTGKWGKYAEGVASFHTSLRAHPRDPHALMALSSLYVIAGQYDTALPLLERSVELELAPAGEIPMIGALTLLGLTHARRGDSRQAGECLERAATQYAASPQIFRPYINALTTCALGDRQRCEGRYDEAVAFYVRARALLEPAPALLGSGYLRVRIETRLATAFGALRMRTAEEEHHRTAHAIMRARDTNSFHWCWGVSEAELHYDWALYHSARADRSSMLASLQRAVSFGWRETQLLQVEPAFAVYRHDPALLQLVDDDRRHPLPPLPSFDPTLPARLRNDAAVRY